MNWLELAKREIRERPEQRTAVTAEINFGSFGSTPSGDFHPRADDQKPGSRTAVTAEINFGSFGSTPPGHSEAQGKPAPGDPPTLTQGLIARLLHMARRHRYNIEETAELVFLAAQDPSWGLGAVESDEELHQRHGWPL